jgi:hypothetical protein
MASKSASFIKAFFRGLERTVKHFTIEIGPFKATGVPAILVGVTGVVLASGITAALSKGAPRLPETLGEMRGLAEAMKPPQQRLPS